MELDHIHPLDLSVNKTIIKDKTNNEAVIKYRCHTGGGGGLDSFADKYFGITLNNRLHVQFLPKTCWDYLFLITLNTYELLNKIK